jgi:hypothetical protein
LGKGAFGCVTEPSLKCAEEKPDGWYDGKVSKVVKDVKSAEKEFDEAFAVAAIDKHSRYTLPPPTMCLSDPGNAPFIERCGMGVFYNEKGLLQDLPLLITENGGFDLFTLAATPPANWSPVKMDAFWVSCIPLFEGLVDFVEKGKVHQDVKVENILFNPKNGKVIFIDFGLMEDTGELVRNFKGKQILPTKNPQTRFPLDFLIYTEENYAKKKERYTAKNLPKEFFEYVFPWGPAAERVAYSARRKLWFAQEAETFANDDTPFQTFKEKSVQTIDLYGLGTALLTLCNFLAPFEGRVPFEPLMDFLYRCITPNVDARYTAAEALPEYKRFLSEYLPTLETVGEKKRKSLSPTFGVGRPKREGGRRSTRSRRRKTRRTRKKRS